MAILVGSGHSRQQQWRRGIERQRLHRQCEAKIEMAAVLQQFAEQCVLCGQVQAFPIGANRSTAPRQSGSVARDPSPLPLMLWNQDPPVNRDCFPLGEPDRDLGSDQKARLGLPRRMDVSRKSFHRGRFRAKKYRNAHRPALREPARGRGREENRPLCGWPSVYWRSNCRLNS